MTTFAPTRRHGRPYGAKGWRAEARAPRAQDLRVGAIDDPDRALEPLRHELVAYLTPSRMRSVRESCMD
jgi:hypothetical protein